MATPPPAPGAWQQATVVEIAAQTPSVKSFFLRPAVPRPFLPGQHIDVRLTAPDGYQAQRSYSIASAPADPTRIEIAVERLADGEVSPFFHDVVVAGDTIEFRGPIGGHFVWTGAEGGPILLVGGGSGVAPLMAMIRHRALAAPAVPAVLIYSARSLDEVIFRHELLRRAEAEPGFQLLLTLSRASGPAAGLRRGRIGPGLIAEALAGLPGGAPRHAYVCGSNAFVAVASGLLLDAGVAFARIRTERYGGDPALPGDSAPDG